MNEYLYIATKDGICICQREAESWREVHRVLSDQDVTCLTVWDHTVLAGTTRGLFCSTDSGEHWEERSEGVTQRHIRSVAHHFMRPVRTLAGTEPAAVFYSSDCSGMWQESPQVAKLRDQYGWYLPYSPEAGCVRGFAFDGDQGYAAVEQGGVLVSEDGGSTWHMAGGSTGETAVPSRDSGYIHPDVHSIYTHPMTAGWVCAPTGGGLYRSANSGDKWEQLYRCYCRAMWVDPQDANHIIFGPADGVDRRGRIEETRDGGETWKLASDGLDVPWSQHMVEQFVQTQEMLVAVLSNGELIAAPLSTLEWRSFMPEIKGVRAAAALMPEN